MGATASTLRTYNEVNSSRKRGETLIPLHNLTEHLRMFQHHTGGDILILVDEDADAFLADPTSSQYQEIFVSRRGTEYLDQMKCALAFQAQKVMESPKVSPPLAIKLPSTASETGAAAYGDAEPTLYQKHQQENPHLKFKHSDPLSNQFVTTPPAKESKLSTVTSGDKREHDLTTGASFTTNSTSPYRGAEEPTGGTSGGSFDTTPTTSGNPANRLSFGSPSMSREHQRDPVATLSPSTSGLGLNRATPDREETHTFASISKNPDPTGTPPRGTLLSSSSTSAIDFHRHEQEMLSRSRTHTDADADAKSAPLGANFGIASPHHERAGSKSDLPTISPRHLPPTSPRVPTGAMSGNTVISPASSTLDRVPSSMTITPRSRSDSRAENKEESKDSKETLDPPQAPSTPRVRARDFEPVAYLPPNVLHRERIAEEEKRSQHMPPIAKQRSGIALGQYSATSSIDFTSKDPSRNTSFQVDAKDHPTGLISRSFGMFDPSAAADSKHPSSIRGVPTLGTQLSNISHATSGSTAGISNSGSGSVREVSAPDAVVAMHVEKTCPVCGLDLFHLGNSAEDAAHIERHVNACTMRREMKSALASIDQNLAPKLDELADSNRSQLNVALSAVIGKVAEEFDHTSAAHSAVKKLVTSVLRVNYDTSTRKLDRMDEAMRTMQLRVATEISDAHLLYSHGNTDVIRKITAFNNLARILEQTADKLALKRHNITLYKKYLVGIQDFKVLRKLGKGAFASVYLARVIDTKQMYAIKVLHKKDVLQRHLLDQVMKERTAMVMSSRYPDYFVELLFAFQSKNELFLVMEYMHGGDCLSLLSSVKRLPEHVAQHFIAQVCLAVRHLHAHGVIHRDIKPDNVMITARGHAKLGDFGSVCPIHPDYLHRDPAVYPEKRKRKDESLLSQSLASRSDTHFLSPSHGHHHGAGAGASNSMNVSGSGVSGVSGVSFSGLSNVSTSPGTNAVTASGAATAATSPTAAGVVLHTGSNNNNNNNHNNNGTNNTVSTQPISPPSAHTRVSTKAHFNSAIHTMSHEISTMASLAFHKSSKSSSSASNSMWLEEEYDQNVLQTLPERAESSSNWSSDGSSSSSSLFFNRGQRGGVVMQNTFDIVGNYFYASPEMAGGTCILNQAVDWWAVGVLLFHLLSGTTPFEGLTKASTLENIENKICDWDALPEDVSLDCRDFLHRFLAHNYETRLGTDSAEDVLNHVFFGNIDFATLYDGYGPFYPRPPRVNDINDPDFYSFSALSEEESRNIPRFSPPEGPTTQGQDTENAARRTSVSRYDDSKEAYYLESKHGGEDRPTAHTTSTTNTHSTVAEYNENADNPELGSIEDEVFQDFDYHPI